MASTRCPCPPDGAVAAPLTDSVARRAPGQCPAHGLALHACLIWMTGSIRASPVVRRLGIMGRASGPHGTCEVVVPVAGGAPAPGSRRGGPMVRCPTNRRARRARHSSRIPTRCRPMALPRSCRSSSPPSTSHTLPSMAVQTRSRFAAKLPVPAPYTHARSRHARTLTNSSSDPLRLRPAPLALPALARLALLPRPRLLPCRPARRTPTPTRLGSRYSSPVSCDSHVADACASFQFTHASRDAARSGRSPDCASRGRRGPLPRRPRTSNTNCPPSTPSRPRIV